MTKPTTIHIYSFRLMLLLFVFGCTNSQLHSNIQLKERWVRIECNTFSESSIHETIELVERAVKVGYNGVLLVSFRDDSYWSFPQNTQELHEKNLKRVSNHIRSHNLKLVSSVSNFGYSSPLLRHNPNYASGLPVIDCELIAKNGELIATPITSLDNPSFEHHQKHRVIGSKFQDLPGGCSFIDENIKKHGQSSLRLENFESAPNHQVRFAKSIDLQAYQQIKLTFWIKAEDFTGDLRFLVSGGDGFKDKLMPQQLSVPRDQPEQLHPRSFFIHRQNWTQDWIQQTLSFNTLQHERISLLFGVYRGTKGKVWIDDMKIEKAVALNVLKRPSLPITVKHASSSKRYNIGRDIQDIVDPHLGKEPYLGGYGVHHSAPKILLSPNTRIREGQKVKISYHHAQPQFANSQTCASVNEDLVYDWVREGVRRLHRLISPDGLLNGSNEIRIGAWEDIAMNHRRRPLKASAMSVHANTGKQLAKNLRRVSRIHLDENQKRPLYIWSDMFDPNLNARKGFYLQRGDLSGSWRGILPNTTVLTWVPNGKVTSMGPKSLKFFSERGHHQLLGAFYDQNVSDNHKDWTAASKNIKGIHGVVYCTWNRDFSQLESFANVWWGAKAR